MVDGNVPRHIPVKAGGRDAQGSEPFAAKLLRITTRIVRSDASAAIVKAIRPAIATAARAGAVNEGCAAVRDDAGVSVAIGLGNFVHRRLLCVGPSSPKRSGSLLMIACVA